MKTKLLKKIRKRFDIIHQPHGHMYDNYHYNYNLYKLVDNDGSFCDDVYVQLGRTDTHNQYCSDIFFTEKECIDFLKDKIVKVLKSESHTYSRKNRNIQSKYKKVWYTL